MSLLFVGLLEEINVGWLVKITVGFFGFGVFVVVLMEVVVMSCGFESLRKRWWWVVRMMVGLSL